MDANLSKYKGQIEAQHQETWSYYDIHGQWTLETS